MTTSTAAEIRATIVRALRRIAPEADIDTLDPDLSVREQLDIDSMDFLNFAIALHKEFGVAIPEADYPALLTLNGAVAYIQHAPAATAGS